jgi:hypothetical protein
VGAAISKRITPERTSKDFNMAAFPVAGAGIGILQLIGFLARIISHTDGFALNRSSSATDS